ncbi:MAG: MFS transporter [Betaproteobacteria bacterium]|nr:MAG: MFS transporter [Betaproteobacteria bacterium]
MSAVTPRGAILAPFRIPSYRYQWPADLATSCAFEMETLILGWYVLTETGSVLLLTLFASLQHLGTLISPMFGVVGDRIGQRVLLSGMRAVYATLASVVMLLAFTDVLEPFYVLIIAGLMGLVRPSDIGMRAALVGETMPPSQLMSAMSIQRTTQDSARIAGALSGAGLVALLGMGPAYGVVASLYTASVLLTLRAGSKRPPKTAAPTPSPAPSPWRDLRSGLSYVWNTPHLRAMMCLAFLLNLTAFPLMTGLLPYVAKEVYQADRIWLGYMVAAAASGALIGSLILSRYGSSVQPSRMGIVFSGAWYVMLIVFSQLPQPSAGLIALAFAGCVQSLALVPMTTMLLRTSDERFRGRVMGIRMLAIYGNLPGLLLSGPLISKFGYPTTAAAYCIFGLALTLVITLYWQRHLWHAGAFANRRG